MFRLIFPILSVFYGVSVTCSMRLTDCQISLTSDDLLNFNKCSKKPVETCLGMYDCVLLISGYWAICWRRSTERVRTVSLSRLTSVLAMVLCLVVGVGFCGWFVFSCFGGSCVVVSLFSLVHHTLRHT